MYSRVHTMSALRSSRRASPSRPAYRRTSRMRETQDVERNEDGERGVRVHAARCTLHAAKEHVPGTSPNTLPPPRDAGALAVGHHPTHRPIASQMPLLGVLIRRGDVLRCSALLCSRAFPSLRPSLWVFWCHHPDELAELAAVGPRLGSWLFCRPAIRRRWSHTEYVVVCRSAWWW